ncbi:MAG: hypothetical protein AAF564_22245 [Bacteroidota bacterium]
MNKQRFNAFQDYIHDRWIDVREVGGAPATILALTAIIVGGLILFGHSAAAMGAAVGGLFGSIGYWMFNTSTRRFWQVMAVCYSVLIVAFAIGWFVR